MSTDMKYIHPHSESRIIDNSVLTVSASGLSNKFIALEAEKGMPNEATYISSPSEYTFNFGEPNYNKYGQSGLNAIQWLRAGGGLWVVRVVPDDETFAGLSVGIGYRKDSEYANDEPEFKRLERTADQIDLWNAVKPAGPQGVVMAKGKASGNSVLLPKFYAMKNGATKPEISLGMLTADAINLMNVSIAKDEDKYAPAAVRQVTCIENQNLRLRFKAEIIAPDTIAVYVREGDTLTREEGNFYRLVDEAKVKETSAAAFDAYEDDTGDEAKKHKYIRLDSLANNSYTPVVITVKAQFCGYSANNIVSLITAYCDEKPSNRSAKLYSGSSYADNFAIDTRISYINRLNELKDNFTNASAKHTADLINLLKAEITAAGDDGSVDKDYDLESLDVVGGSSSAWFNSYEVYRFTPKVYGQVEGAVRPISEKEMSEISSKTSTSQPALTDVEFKDWIFANKLDEKAFVLGSQFGQSASDLAGVENQETGTNGVLITDQGVIIGFDPNSSEALTSLSATNPEVVVSVPSTGYYELTKLYYVNNASTGKELSSMTTTDPEAAIYNFTNSSEGRYANVLPDPTDWATKYVYGTADKVSKPVMEYTVLSKVADNQSDVTAEGFTVGAQTTRAEDIISSLMKFLSEVCSKGKKYGGNGFMKFSLDDDNKTIVTFPLTSAFLNTEEYGWLEGNGDLQKLFVEAQGQPGKYILNPGPISDTNFPSELKAGGRYQALSGNDGAASEGGLYYRTGSDNSVVYTLNTDRIAGWKIILGSVNTFLTKMLASEDNTVEGIGDSAGKTVDIHYAPYYKAAIIDGDGFWGITMKYDATALDNAVFTALMSSEDPDHAVTVSSKSTGEYAFYTERAVSDAKGMQNEPNPDYANAQYDAIGFVSTPYSVFELQGSKYYEDDPEVVEARAESTKGRVVGSTLDSITTIPVSDMRIPATSYAEFLRFLPKGSGKWYNRLSVNLSYDDSMDRTYTEWSMFRLTISEKVDGGEISREAFNVSLDPDAISAAKESLFIEDVVNRFSKYLTCVVNYDNLANFIEAKLPIQDEDNKPVEDEDGNEITVPVDAVIKYINNQIDLDEFNERIFGTGYEETKLAKYKIEHLMSAIGYDANLCHLDTTIYDSDGERQYLEPFVSLYLFQTVSSTSSLYLNGGTYGRGWGYEHETNDGELVTNSTLEQALVKAYNGTTDSIITNINLCVFDMVMDCNYPVVVKTAMNELSSVIRQDCVTILDQGISTANAQQAIDMRKNQMQYDTFYTSIFTQHLEITDEWSGRPVKVTPTFFLASKIPLNDTAYSPAVNFVGPNRGVISGFNSVSWIPTEPEKDQLYRNQINYIERDNIATLFATELTSQTKNTPLTLIHAVRTLLRLRRSMVAVSRSYRSEFANSDVYGLLQTELNEIASSYVLAGGYEYITPVINTSDYDRQQRICRVDVDVAFTDIIERFAFNFIVNRV